MTKMLRKERTGEWKCVCVEGWRGGGVGGRGCSYHEIDLLGRVGPDGAGRPDLSGAACAAAQLPLGGGGGAGGVARGGVAVNPGGAGGDGCVDGCAEEGDTLAGTAALSGKDGGDEAAPQLQVGGPCVAVLPVCHEHERRHVRPPRRLGRVAHPRVGPVDHLTSVSRRQPPPALQRAVGQGGAQGAGGQGQRA